ncbi:DUF445 family protein [Polycyclovorans algicola]|uniref:DUF445 family protein n=1 Tax=Polycyclovorans algicola TaxID=616992 RepID=UPI00069402F4|nr:DUF445 family protein [Polycyclovorans algicola]
MTFDMEVWDQRFRRTLLLTAVALGVLDYWAGGANPWFRSGFVITIAGCVGYFTNFLAIKMLFQPKKGQVLGWRGLVPKNQAHIARSLGESVQAQLLSPDIVLAYIAERQLIERSTAALAEWIDANLQKPEVRREITTVIVTLLNERGPELLTAIFDLGEEGAKGVARNPQSIEAYWQRVRAALNDFLQDAENRELVMHFIRRVLSQQMPMMADWLDRAIEGYLQQKRGVGRVGLGLKSLLSIDQAAIEQLLTRFVQDERIANEVLVMLDAIMQSVQADLASESKQATLQHELEIWIGKISSVSRRHLLPAISEQFGDYLSNEANWSQVENLLIRFIQWLKDRALSVLHSDTGKTYLRAAIERAVQQLNVTGLVEQQVMKLDSDELEAMVLNNTGGNLTIIQVLGGVLGLIVGLVQVHLFFAVPLGGAAAAVWVAYRLNQRRYRDA